MKANSNNGEYSHFFFFLILLSFNLLGHPATAKNFPNMKNNFFG